MRSLNQYEEEVCEEEHESVVEHDGVEERLAREDQVDDVGHEETEDREAQHDGVNHPEDVWLTPRQTDVNHPPTSALAGVGRGQAVAACGGRISSILIGPAPTLLRSHWSRASEW